MREVASCAPWAPLSRRERGRGEGISVSDKGQPQFLPNPRKNQIEIVADFSVGEADDAHAEIFDHLGPAVVMIDEPVMLLAVPPDPSPGVDDELAP